MKNPVKTFEPNVLGRDFVMGDLHGSLSCFQNLLKQLHFDTTKDRMFSVGDLIDRGPNSLECLELLREPWFHAVLANHEEMMLEAFDGGPWAGSWSHNGGGWGMAAKNDWDQRKLRPSEPDSLRVFDMLPLVRDMPYLITVKMTDGRKFHIMHAELVPQRGLTDEMLADPEKVLAIAKEQTRNGDVLLWGRFLFQHLYRANLQDIPKILRTLAYHQYHKTFNDELSHIISGHTILQRPVTIIGQTNIDTGAYCSYASGAKDHEALTCVELGSWTFYQATESLFRTVEPLVLNRDDIPARSS